MLYLSPEGSAAVLDGFTAAEKKLQPKRVYRPPQLPRGYRPGQSNLPTQPPGGSSVAPPPQPTAVRMKWKKMDAGKRAAMLGETPGNQ